MHDGDEQMTALNSSIEAIRIAAAAADRMKGRDIVAFDVSVPLAITDIMMIVTGTNRRQVLAIAEEIEKDLYEKAGKRETRSREGLMEGEWVLLDYGDFVIDVFNREAREFYGLERLWQDCPAIDLELPEPGDGNTLTDANDAMSGSDAAPDDGVRRDARDASDEGGRP